MHFLAILANGANNCHLFSVHWYLCFESHKLFYLIELLKMLKCVSLTVFQNIILIIKRRLALFNEFLSCLFSF